MEHIIKEASQSSRIPLLEKEAASGMVPYMHRGEAIPSRLAGIMPASPRRLSPIDRNILWILSFRNTETQEPSRIPTAQ